MRNLLFLTSHFPYEGGEQFIESEIPYWEYTRFNNILIIPYKSKGVIRNYPKRMKIIKLNFIRYKFYYVLLSFFSNLFYREIIYILKNCNLIDWPANFELALKTTAITLKIKQGLMDFLKNYEGEISIYSYWNDVSFYAACELKRKGIIKHVISRAHGFDIYEERRINKYMPLKRQYVDQFDKVYLLSDNALNYYKDVYGVNLKKLDVSRLGVKIPSKIPEIEPIRSKVKVLSLSYCVPVKRIDKIMAAVEHYVQANKNMLIEWMHIGSGPLFEKLKASTNELEHKYNNLRISFVGHLENQEVKNTLSNNYFDVFINASEYEGVPVSIMEAMSYGIPAIGPNVGGISSLINENNGYLLPDNFTISNILSGIEKILSEDKKQTYRVNARYWVEKYFNSDINYPLFVKQVESDVGLYDS